MSEIQITKENIGNLFAAWRDGKVPFTEKNLDDLLWFYQYDLHVTHLNTALDLFQLIFRVCENKKLEDKCNAVFKRFDDDVKYNGKVVFKMLDILKDKNIISEEEYTKIVEPTNKNE